MITNFDILSDDEMDADFEKAHSFEYKKLKQETKEQKDARMEFQRITEIRNILKGGFKIGSVIEPKLTFLLTNDIYNSSPGLIEDSVIDRYGNTALHYAVAPDCAGPLTIEQLAALAVSMITETVLSSNINPHIVNKQGLSALNFVKDLDLLDMIEDRTRVYRKDVYCPIHFAAVRSQLKIKGV